MFWNWKVRQGISCLWTERLDKKREEEEKRRLEEMSEDEYDELTEEEKAQVDRKRLKAKKERLLKK